MKLKQLYRRVPDENGFMHDIIAKGQRLSRYIINSDGVIVDTVTGKEMTHYTKNTNGVLSIIATLRFPDNSYKNVSVRTLVADNFMPMTEDDIENKRCRIMAIDGDNTNVSVENLRRIDNREYVANSTRDCEIVRYSKYHEYYDEIDKDLANIDLSLNDVFEKWNPICGIGYNRLSKRASKMGFSRKKKYDDTIKQFAKVQHKNGVNTYTIARRIEEKFNIEIPIATVEDWFKNR